MCFAGIYLYSEQCSTCHVKQETGWYDNNVIYSEHYEQASTTCITKSPLGRTVLSLAFSSYIKHKILMRYVTYLNSMYEKTLAESVCRIGTKRNFRNWNGSISMTCLCLLIAFFIFIFFTHYRTNINIHLLCTDSTHVFLLEIVVTKRGQHFHVWRYNSKLS